MHEELHAPQRPRDLGSVSSVDQPKAGDSGPLSERCVTCQSDGIHAKIRDADEDRPLIPSSRRIDIRQLDFVALKTAGYRGAVVDKDNCLVRLP